MPIEPHGLVTLVPLAIIGVTGIVRWTLGKLRGVSEAGDPGPWR
jgi:hypothetical protein